LIRLGGETTAEFIRIDNAITSFSSQWQEFQGLAGNKLLKGVNAGVLDKLKEIKKLAIALKSHAETELAHMQIPVHGE
jgi:conjugal transfer/entry exclusion protein